jgi:sugar lactone lactonase YvrE
MKHFIESPGVLADTADLCGECPIWIAESKEVLWTDCVGLKVHRFDWADRKCRLTASNIEIYGFRPNRAGGFAVTNTTGVWLWDIKGPLQPVASEVDGSRLQLNDCCADSQGQLITSSFFYNPGGEYELGRLVRIDNKGRAVTLDDGFHLGNGIGLSPDEKTLYFTDTVARKIFAYDYDKTAGAARRRVFAEVPSTEGIPDGLAVDAEGHVWSAQWYGGCVVRYDPDGHVERRIAVPAKQTSSVAFGGPDLTDIFITSAGQSERMPVMPPGYDPDSGPIGGALYHLNLGIAGLPQFPAMIRPLG